MIKHWLNKFFFFAFQIVLWFPQGLFDCRWGVYPTHSRNFCASHPTLLEISLQKWKFDIKTHVFKEFLTSKLWVSHSATRLEKIHITNFCFHFFHTQYYILVGYHKYVIKRLKYFASCVQSPNESGQCWNFLKSLCRLSWKIPSFLSYPLYIYIIHNHLGPIARVFNEKTPQIFCDFFNEIRREPESNYFFIFCKDWEDDTEIEDTLQPMFIFFLYMSAAF